MDAEDSLHFTPLHCRMWLTVGNRWYLETFFPTLHAQSEGIAIVSQRFMHVIKLIVIVLLYTIIVSSEGDSRPFIAMQMYVQTNHCLARHSACSIATYCNSSLHQYPLAYGIFLSILEYLKVIKYLSYNFCGYTCIFTCPADVAQPIPEDISKENDDQIQAVLDATATRVGQSAAILQGLRIADIAS